MTERPKLGADGAGAAYGDDARVSVLAELDEIVIAYKPASWATEPTPQSAECLVRSVADQLGLPRVHAASRLDVGVSGIVVCTTGERGACALAELRAAGSLRHDYLAIASGKIESAGHWSGALGRSRDGAGRARAVVDGPGARAARTDYSVVAHAPASATLLRLTLQTGRMHQIRAHAATAGHPLLGDRRYRGPTSIVVPGGRVVEVARPALHCARVELGAGVTVEAPVPNDLRTLWRTLGGADEIWTAALRDESSGSSTR